jgi:hypothetical protein
MNYPLNTNRPSLELRKALELKHVGTTVDSDLDPTLWTLIVVRSVQLHLGIIEWTWSIPIFAHKTFSCLWPKNGGSELRLMPFLAVPHPTKVPDEGVNLTTPRRAVTVDDLLSATKTDFVLTATNFFSVSQILDLSLQLDPISVTVNRLTAKSTSQGHGNPAPKGQSNSIGYSWPR